MATKRHTGEKRKIPDDNEERISTKHNTREKDSEEKRMKISGDNVEVNKKILEKLLRSDSQIIAKLDILINGQRSLENRLTDLEKKLNDNNKNKNIANPDYIKDLVKKVAKILFEKSIYPSQNEYRDATEKFLKEEDPDYLKQFKKNEWVLFYEKNISQNLAQQHKSVRGTFTSRVKDVMYAVFEENGCKIPSINSQFSPSKIQEWKNKPEVKRCYKNLFKRVKDDQPTTYMSMIIERLRKEDKNPSNPKIAYTISICETYLNPGNQEIKISERLIKPKLIEYLHKLENKEKFSCSDDDSPVSPTATDTDGNGTGNDTADAGSGVTVADEANNAADNDDAAIFESDDAYNTEEENRYLNSLFENYELYKKN